MQKHPQSTHPKRVHGRDPSKQEGVRPKAPEEVNRLNQNVAGGGRGEHRGVVRGVQADQRRHRVGLAGPRAAAATAPLALPASASRLRPAGPPPRLVRRRLLALLPLREPCQRAGQR